ncbi:hypothetical protein RIF29_16446 [Crotalaria pallida]|uniref:Uncharacterized protein n=1 Tax=Crotalaria pallida TaxID=3830 RepID=A0AAN9IC18_CROPI
MKTASKKFEDEKEQVVGAFPIWDCGSPLYDSNELVSISDKIERHMNVWPYFGGPKQVITKLSDPPDEVMISISTTNARGSSKLRSLSEFLKKIIWKKGKYKKHKKAQVGLYGVFNNRLVCGGNKVSHE